jgi:hypothetical protein
MPTSYGTIQTVSITLDGLAAGAEATSTAIDNTTNKYDYLSVVMKLKPGVVRVNGYITIDLLASNDNTNFADYGQYKMTLGLNGMSLVSSTSKQYSFFLKDLPPYFKIIVRNRSGDALSAAGGDNTMTYIGMVR